MLSRTLSAAVGAQGGWQTVPASSRWKGRPQAKKGTGSSPGNTPQRCLCEDERALQERRIRASTSLHSAVARQLGAVVDKKVGPDVTPAEGEG